MTAAALIVAWMVASSHVPPWVRLVLFVVMVVAFARTCRRPPSVRRIFVASAVVLTVATVLMPRDSGDVYMYGMFGSIAGNHHASPYLHTPQEYAEDPLLQPTVQQWRHVRSPYGPAFTALSAGIAKVAHDSPMLSVRFFQILDALTVLAIAWLVYRTTRDPKIVAFIGLNPALAAMTNGGHNDVLVAGLLVAAVLSKRFTAVLLALAVCMKVTAALPVAVFLVWMLWNKRDRQTFMMAIVTTLLAVAAYAAFGIGNVVSSLNDSGMVTSRVSLWTLPHHLFGKTGMYACMTLVATVTFFSVRRHVGNATVAMALAAIVEVFLYPYVLPWYAASSIALAALTRSTRLMVIAGVQSLALMLAYTVAPGDHVAGLFAVLSAAAFPLSAALAVLSSRSTRTSR